MSGTSTQHGPPARDGQWLRAILGFHAVKTTRQLDHERALTFGEPVACRGRHRYRPAVSVRGPCGDGARNVGGTTRGPLCPFVPVWMEGLFVSRSAASRKKRKDHGKPSLYADNARNLCPPVHHRRYHLAAPSARNVRSRCGVSQRGIRIEAGRCTPVHESS
jgi:hypothetical protein